MTLGVRRKGIFPFRIRTLMVQTLINLAQKYGVRKGKRKADNENLVVILQNFDLQFVFLKLLT